MARDSSESAQVEIALFAAAFVCVAALCALPVPKDAEPPTERTLDEWHSAGLLISLTGVVLSYFDDVPVVVAGGGQNVRLLGRLRWHTLAAQNTIMVALLFLGNVLLDGGVKHPRVLRLVRVLLTVTYPVSVFIGVFYRLVLVPSYYRAGEKWARLGLGGRPRPLILYNSGLVLTTGEVMLSRVRISWRDMPALVLFAVWYSSQHIEFVKKHGVCLYDVLDHRRPGALWRFFAVLVGSCLLFAVGPMATHLVLESPFGQLGSLAGLLCGSMLFVPLFAPKTKPPAPVTTNTDPANPLKFGKSD